ncbi:hypothetical protein [Kitasatospora sp. SUK 42]|uniref:hypothetical protein n=1 Tax=Kitasatospora sp. SUK 42 TaxID=1588882 RepID=UPI0018C9F96F|nr:hypothetical protein [Kitasatospora sp. SUK 42]MBV2155094.1 hypothetical protein [Kitasatospora sp. SUK 42]
MTREDEFLRRMREIQDGREKAIVPLAAIMAERKHLKDQLAETEVPYGRAYAAAEAAGWSAEELVRLGVEAPARRPKGRPRKHAPTTKTTVPGPSSGGEESNADASVQSG